MPIIRKMNNSTIITKVATTENINLFGIQTIDSVLLLNGDRVFVKDQNDKTENGVYICSESNWIRAEDYDTNYEILSDFIFYVTDGEQNKDTFWIALPYNGPHILGETELSFKKILTDIRNSDIPYGSYYTNMNSLLKRGLVYYGYPSSLNNSNGNVNRAVEHFQVYDKIVIGDGLQFSTHSDHTKTKQIISLLKDIKKDIEIFGYVPIGQDKNITGSNLPIEEIKYRIDLWQDMGVTGIFLDEFGYDYLVTRERQNECVDYCHNKGFNVVANSYGVEYAFSPTNVYLDWLDFNGNPNNLESKLNSNDYIMFESMFFTKNSDNTFRASSNSRFREAAYYYETPRSEYGGKTYKEHFGTKAWALDVFPTEDQNIFNFCYAISIGLGFDVYSVSYSGYSNSIQNPFQIPKMPPVLNMNNGKLKSSSLNGTNFALFERTIGDCNIKIIWKPDPSPNDRDPNFGTREVYINDELFASVRPNVPPSIAKVGSGIFDTSIGKPIWFNGTNWVDSNGIIVY